MTTLADFAALNQVTVPDLWQQQAVAALREGSDVVVQAPTGAGKTLIFELWSNQGKNRGQAIYTVPTRALANDKLAEWRARGWDVGIATGDLAENLHAPILVATLETQKNRLIQGDGPALLVVDEYQMIRDLDRGLNYELAIALAPLRTQLLLLSGSVANPQDVVKWLQRLGRKALVIRYDERPVPLEEVHANNLNYHVPAEIRGYWPRLVAKALAEDLGPILIFAPRRQAAEAMAADLARQLPTPNPLQLSADQRLLVGDHLTRLLKSRVAYHHSGLSYGARAGVIEPLAKAGQLRVVVATMGLAAGINFSLRSVSLAAESYRRDEVEQLLKPDEILQMFGRAGRRGLDETGFVLISANELRLLDARPCHLSRSGAVDWSALLGLMTLAARQGRDPFREAVRAQERLFTIKPIILGVEECLRHPDTPCGLKTDAERARHVRKRVRQMLNSRGEWEDYPQPKEVPLKEIRILSDASDEPDSSDRSDRSVLSEHAALEKVGVGTLCLLSEHPKVYGRSLTVADRLGGDRVILAKWIRRLTNWKGRQAPLALWHQKIAPLVEHKLALQKTPVVRFQNQAERIVAVVTLSDLTMRVPVDSHGVALWKPPEREIFPPDCAQCQLTRLCAQLPASTGVALLWRRLGLVDASGVPTLRGQLVSFFSQGDGLAIAAALEEPGRPNPLRGPLSPSQGNRENAPQGSINAGSPPLPLRGGEGRGEGAAPLSAPNTPRVPLPHPYPLDELIYDLANLDGGFRFCGEDNRWGGRLADVCHEKYGLQSIPGYLENGVPPKYGAGAEQIVASVHKNPQNKHGWITDLVGPGDIDRVIIEWRSLLRQIAHAPDLDWPRWRALQALAKTILNETQSPTLTDLPPLDFNQTRRVDHRLILRRH